MLVISKMLHIIGKNFLNKYFKGLIFIRSRRVGLLKTLGPAFRSNTVCLAQSLRYKNGKTTAIGARIETSLPPKRFTHFIKFNKLFYLFIVSLIFLLNACVAPKLQTQIIKGETMGTTYIVKYVSDVQISKKAIDDLLVSINQSVSTYIPL